MITLMAAGGVIVFIGDSITDSDRRTDRSGLGYGYVDMVARALRDRGDPSTVVNAGIAGDRIAHLQQRWRSDVLDAAFVPLQSVVDAAAAERGPTMVAADGVHPTPVGAALIAEAWLAAYASCQDGGGSRSR